LFWQHPQSLKQTTNPASTEVGFVVSWDDKGRCELSQPYSQAVFAERFQGDDATNMRRIGWCSRKDVVDAFRIVGQEIRTKCQRIVPKVLTQAEACRLALRIRDQRELIRQIADRRDSRHVRCLLRLNRKRRHHLMELATQAGLNTTILTFK